MEGWQETWCVLEQLGIFIRELNLSFTLHFNKNTLKISILYSNQRSWAIDNGRWQFLRGVIQKW
jgi:hypothetical protein